MKGYIFDVLYLGVFLIVLLLICYVWFYTAPKVDSALNNADSTAIKNKVDQGFTSFDSYLIYLFAALDLAIIFAFAVIPVSRAMVFIFALLFMFIGVFLQGFDQAVANILLLVAGTVPMPNLLSLIGQYKILSIVTGMVMLIVGFTRKER